MKKNFHINGSVKELELSPNDTLLQTLRNNNFTEVKCGCNEGECGACTVLLENKAVNSCQVLSMSVQEKEITTVKGIGTLYQPHLVQTSFVEAGGDQCGFCSPGMALAAYSLLQENPNPSRDEILVALDGNLCRCTGYVKIIDAVELAARKIAAEIKETE